MARLFNLFNRNCNFKRNQRFNLNNTQNRQNNLNISSNLPIVNNQQNFNTLGQNSFPNFQNNFNNGVNVKPITAEEMEEIQKEIQENIKKVNEKHTKYTSENNCIDYFEIGNLIQNEQNSGKFYLALSSKFEDKKNNDIIKNISNECFKQVDKLQQIYKEKNKQEYLFKNIEITTDIGIKESLFLAINEEILSCEKICEILESINNNEIYNYFNKMIFYKLKRIACLQLLILQNMS